jgi:Tol biopolymer transport system component
MVAGDSNGIPDVFVRDMQSATTILASVGAWSPGANPNIGVIGSGRPELSGDGRFVAFYSSATNLVPGVLSSGDIYVRDLIGGTTSWASTAARTALQNAFGTANGVCYNHALSADGKFVAYEISPGPGTPSRPGVILRYSLDTAITDLVSTNGRGNAGAYADSQNLDISSDGRFIAFVAFTNLPSGGVTCIQVWDAQAGSITLASGDSNNQLPTNSICDWPALDPAGRYVTFLGAGSGLSTNSTQPGSYHVYARDLQTASTMLVDTTPDRAGAGLNPTTSPRLSADGRWVAFESPDGSLASGDANRASDIFVRDLTSQTLELVSVCHPELTSFMANGQSSLWPRSVSDDGRWITFASDGNNLVPNDLNGARDVFVRDLITGTNILISVATNGTATGNETSWEPVITPDGRYVAFTSRASDLVDGDTNSKSDVFVRDLQVGTTTLVSVNTGGTGPGNNDSYSPSLSTNGRFVLFFSWASDLASGSSSSVVNLLWRDLQAGVTHLLSTTVSEPIGRPAAMTPDGRFVVAATGGVSVWDMNTATLVYSGGGVIRNVGISPDGNRIAFASQSQVQVFNRALSSTVTVSSTAPPRSRTGLRFSGDSRFLTFTATLNGTNQVYLYDFQTSAKTLVSHAFGTSAAANAGSDSPDISSDGRFVSYRSDSLNIVPGDTNGLPDIFLYDRLGSTNMALSLSRSGASTGNHRSIAPVFSADGRTVAFLSWASDLVDQDFNQASDIYALSPYSIGSIPPFSIAISLAGSPGQGSWLSWPVVPGKTYGAQFKNDLSDPFWQDLNASVVMVGNTAWLQDIAPGAATRFYRILAFQ